MANSTKGENLQVEKEITETTNVRNSEEQPNTPYPSVSNENADDIKVYITDKKAPLIVLFGPPTCGKTTTLMRLCRWLHKKGYTITPDRNFRDSNDNDYKKLCEDFPQMITNDHAPQGTRVVEFLLVKVARQGRVICQILEASGEHYYDPDKPNKEFPPFVYEIMHAPNKRIWTIILEPIAGQEKRLNYVSRVNKLRTNMQMADKTIFLFNKIDETSNLVVSAGVVRTNEAKHHVNDLYPGIFEKFRNQVPILSWFKPYNFDFVPFQTGTYSSTKLYTESHDNYPANLWKTIQENINGWK